MSPPCPSPWGNARQQEILSRWFLLWFLCHFLKITRKCHAFHCCRKRTSYLMIWFNSILWIWLILQEGSFSPKVKGKSVFCQGNWGSSPVTNQQSHLGQHGHLHHLQLATLRLNCHGTQVAIGLDSKLRPKLKLWLGMRVCVLAYTPTQIHVCTRIFQTMPSFSYPSLHLHTVFVRASFSSSEISCSFIKILWDWQRDQRVHVRACHSDQQKL